MIGMPVAAVGSPRDNRVRADVRHHSAQLPARFRKHLNRAETGIRKSQQDRRLRAERLARALRLLFACGGERRAGRNAAERRHPLVAVGDNREDDARTRVSRVSRQERADDCLVVRMRDDSEQGSLRGRPFLCRWHGRGRGDGERDGERAQQAGQHGGW